MHRRFVLLLAVLALSAQAIEAQRREDTRSLLAFRSDDDLAAYLRDLVEERDRRLKAEADRVRRSRGANCGAIRVTRRGESLPATGGDGAVVHGRVIDASGTAIGGAVVTIDSLALLAQTSAAGTFRITVPRGRLTRRGDWTMSVRRLGYDPGQRVIRIGPRDSLELTVTLCMHTMLLQESVSVSAPDAFEQRREDAITNTQHAGIDEGGIVKVHGDHLVILRRGRLFTVRLSDGLRPVSMVDAFAPGMNPSGAWYDEMLVVGDKVVVIGYSYASRAAEISVFWIDSAARLGHISTYHLRSHDYYSSRNYASRLLGTKLVLYTPHYIWFERKDPLAILPAMRKWRTDAGEGEFRRIITGTHVYRAPVELDPMDVALHTVITCDLSTPELECEANAVLGPSGRVFYVSSTAVYAWMSQRRLADREPSASTLLYRLPLDGSKPKALQASGSPVDQFSFLESEDGHLNVLVRETTNGEAMWQAERTAGDIALLRFPLESFGDGRQSISPFRYRRLPSLAAPALINRFVGDYVLYGTGNRWGPPSTHESVLYAVPWRDGEAARIPLRHGTDRIEVMGTHAVVIGTDGRNLHFSGIRLGSKPAVTLRYTMKDAAQGELRSHGFFYKADDTDSGILGLPVREGGSPGFKHLRESSASVLFLRRAGSRFAELGTLDADASPSSDDACVASCIDWYGNARPIFIRGRILALLGYELVEGRIENDRIQEVERVSFAPDLVRATGQ